MIPIHNYYNDFSECSFFFFYDFQLYFPYTNIQQYQNIENLNEQGSDEKTKN